MKLSIKHDRLQQASEDARNLLGWTTEQEAEFVYKLGLRYLNKRRLTHAWERKKAFWNWIKLEYCRACFDALFCKTRQNESLTWFVREHHRRVAEIYNHYPDHHVITARASQSLKIKEKV